jgi:predicted DNA-binding ribbon-helix-helix protein
MSQDRDWLRRRSLAIAGHRTSLALEPPFWSVLEAIAAERGLALARLVEEIDAARMAEGAGRPLASACRLHALDHMRARRSEPPSSHS